MIFLIILASVLSIFCLLLGLRLWLTNKMLGACLSGDLEATLAQRCEEVIDIPTLMIQVVPGAEWDGQIWDFSALEKHGIATHVLYVKDSAKKMFGKELDPDNNLTEDELKEYVQKYGAMTQRNQKAGRLKSGEWVWLKT